MSEPIGTFPLSGEEEDATDPRQVSMFGDEYSLWWDEWQGMPEFVQDDLQPVKTVRVHFATAADIAAFAELVEQRITPTTQSIWYPEAEIGHFIDKRYADES